jgi:TolB-like protein
VPDIFISYARSTEAEAQRIADALRSLGYGVWRDDELPAHRPYAEVIEERLKSANAVVVLWSADAVKSQWVRAEAEVGRERRTLVQGALDGTIPPLPFNQIQCADLRDWHEADHPGWRKITASLAELFGRQGRPETPPVALVVQPPERIRIGVDLRPIVMASGRDSQGWAAGLSGDIANAMARLPGLQVLSVEAAPRSHPAPYLVEGTLQRAGEQLLLAVRLKLSVDGTLLWSDRYAGTLHDLFNFQERTATHVASNVDAIVRAREIERSAHIPEDQLDVRQLYYRAIGGLRPLARQSLQDGARYAERAIQLAPDHAHALAVAAVIYMNIWMLGLGVGDGDAFRERAGDHASRALRLSDNDHWVRGLSASVLAWVGHPIEVSIAQLDRTCAGAPSFAVGWFWSGGVRMRAGDPETAIAHLRRAIELEALTPQMSVYTGYLGAAQVIAGDFAGALQSLIEALRARPQWTNLHIFSAIALARLGRIDEARSELTISESFAPVAEARWPTRDVAQRTRLVEGLALVGFRDASRVFADV